jgi:hypothetical protein
LASAASATINACQPLCRAVVVALTTVGIGAQFCAGASAVHIREAVCTRTGRYRAILVQVLRASLGIGSRQCPARPPLRTLIALAINLEGEAISAAYTHLSPGILRLCAVNCLLLAECQREVDRLLARCRRVFDPDTPRCCWLDASPVHALPEAGARCRAFNAAAPAVQRVAGHILAGPRFAAGLIWRADLAAPSAVIPIGANIDANTVAGNRGVRRAFAGALVADLVTGAGFPAAAAVLAVGSQVHTRVAALRVTGGTYPPACAGGASCG